MNPRPGAAPLAQLARIWLYGIAGTSGPKVFTPTTAGLEIKNGGIF